MFSVDGNIALFFTSYSEKNKYLEYCRTLCQKTGKRIVNERKEDNKQKLITGYKKHGNSALLGVCRGSFSEGVDYSGEAMNAVAVIGLPLSQWNIKQKRINQYYKRVFGKEIGEHIAYQLPAVTAAMQSLGRCIRSSQEKGILILGDQRYCNETIHGTKKLLPSEIQTVRIIIALSNLY